MKDFVHEHSTGLFIAMPLLPVFLLGAFAEGVPLNHDMSAPVFESLMCILYRVYFDPWEEVSHVFS